jgi:spermidine synthase
MKKIFLYITVFFSGMTALAIELAASRLLGNVYGSSNLVWACIIGLILIYLTLGYWLGGKLADKHPHYKVLYKVIMWGSLGVGLVPLIARLFFRLTGNFLTGYNVPLLIGAFITVLLLFIFPVTLLGMVSPFALKLALSDTTRAGKVSGMLSAISTLGSFIGTFLPVLILVPLIGTYRTFLFFSSLLMIIGTIGFFIYVDFNSWLRYSWMPLILIILWIFGTRGPDRIGEELIFETESSYNYIQVLEISNYRFLCLNGGLGVHSMYHPTQLNFYGPWSQVLVAPFFNPAPHPIDSIERMAIVGLAAGTTARQADVVFENLIIDGFEIDPDIPEVGEAYFGMDLDNLNVIVQDGRQGLAQTTEIYDIVSIDAYRPPYIPWHMTTVEFFQIVKDHLSDDGVMVINIGRSPLNRDLVNDLGTTIGAVFPNIFVMDIPDTFNTILFATHLDGSWENFISNYQIIANSDVHPLLIEAMTATIENRQSSPQMTRVYTDDRTPIEWITNKIVMDTLLSGEFEFLQ